ncbi:MAG TPA: hypothetical protein VFS21_14940 [Roseiflexaceae bacterium]|nr:hypothetical protein [Roseiflexaceae bacterium]
MTSPRQRGRAGLWGTAALGVAFGVLDWYVPQLLLGLNRHPVFPFLLYGVWLVVAVLAVLPAARRGEQPRVFGRIVLVVWTSAVLAYYSYYAALVALVGLPQLEQLHISQRNAEGFGERWWSLLQTTLLAGVLEWVPVALAGGYVVGWTLGAVWERVAMRRGAAA